MAASSVRVLLSLCLNAILVSCQRSACVWTIQSQNIVYTLDLRALYNETMEYYDAPYYWDYSPCIDGEFCMNQQINGMVLQSDADDTQCFLIARWDASISPTYDRDSNSFTLMYQNGDDCM